MQPNVWGPHLWKSIHYIALGYPNNPDDEVREAYKSFYENLWKVIPCLKCSLNYKRHLDEVPPLDGFMGSRDDLFRWTVTLHNIVNAELGKPQMPLEKARELYITSPFTNAQTSAANNGSGGLGGMSFSKLPVNIALLTLILICVFIAIFAITRKKHG